MEVYITEHSLGKKEATGAAGGSWVKGVERSLP